MATEITIPTELSEITLERYAKFMQLEGDDEFKLLKAIQIFAGVDNPKLLPAKDINLIGTKILNALNQEPKLVRTFKMNGVRYGLIPNLEKMTFGEYIDLDDNIGDYKTLHKAMAVLYRPITSEVNDLYQIEEYKGTEDRAELFKELNMEIVGGVMLFFYHLAKECAKHILTFLTQMKEAQMTLPQEVSSLLSGDGEQLLANWQEVIYLDTPKSLLSLSPSVLARFSTKKNTQN